MAAPFFKDVSSKYGAPMGRAESNHIEGVCTLECVPIDESGYDPGGAYWGTGLPLFCAYDDDGDVKYVRAKDRDEAVKHLRALGFSITFTDTVEYDASHYEDFIQGYLDCALWASVDDSEEDGGEPLDQNYTVEDLAEEALEEMRQECIEFQDANRELLAKYCLEYPASYAGHDFWLTRNGHGAGFWDRGLGQLGDTLTKASKPYGSCYLYVNDGKIYL